MLNKFLFTFLVFTISHLGLSQEASEATQFEVDFCVFVENFKFNFNSVSYVVKGRVFDVYSIKRADIIAIEETVDNPLVWREDVDLITIVYDSESHQTFKMSGFNNTDILYFEYYLIKVLGLSNSNFKDILILMSSDKVDYRELLKCIKMDRNCDKGFASSVPN